MSRLHAAIRVWRIDNGEDSARSARRTTADEAASHDQHRRHPADPCSPAHGLPSGPPAPGLTQCANGPQLTAVRSLGSSCSGCQLLLSRESGRSPLRQMRAECEAVDGRAALHLRPPPRRHPIAHCRVIGSRSEGRRAGSVPGTERIADSQWGLPSGAGPNYLRPSPRQGLPEPCAVSVRQVPRPAGADHSSSGLGIWAELPSTFLG